MGRLTSILFLFYYLILITGMQVSIHYCMGEIEAVSILTENSRCCCDSENISDICCQDDQILLQFKTDEQLETSFTYIFSFQDSEVREFFSLVRQNGSVGQISFIESFKSPPVDNTPLWLKFSNLTYYG